MKGLGIRVILFTLGIILFSYVGRRMQRHPELRVNHRQPRTTKSQSLLTPNHEMSVTTTHRPPPPTLTFLSFLYKFLLLAPSTPPPTGLIRRPKRTSRVRRLQPHRAVSYDPPHQKRKITTREHSATHLSSSSSAYSLIHEGCMVHCPNIHQRIHTRIAGLKSNTM